MNNSLLRYHRGVILISTDICPLCGATDIKSVQDHCHDHGWIRGACCHRCNIVLREADHGIIPNGYDIHKITAWQSRCPECKPRQLCYTNISAVRIPAETKDALLRQRLKVAAEIGRTVTMGEMIAILITLGDKRYSEIVEIATVREHRK